MKNFKKIIASFVMMMSILTVAPVAAHAEWKSDNSGWWYTEGNTYDTGWKYIDGNWYYFYSDGYMAHDCYIGDYYLNSNGAWTNSIPTSNTSSTSYSGASATAQGQTVYVSDKGIYHKSPNAHGMKNYTTMSLSEAQSKGYKACESCYK